MKYRLQVSDDEGAQLIRESDDEVIWSADDDDDFWDGDDDRDTDTDEITDYLVKKGIVESEADITEVIDETGEFEALDDDAESDEPEGDDDD